MRTSLRIIVLALAIAACGESSHGNQPARNDSAGGRGPTGPDQLVLRVSRAGGLARVFAYPQLDSLVWASGTRAPTISRVLAFDADAGSVAFEDSRGVPRTMDFRIGSVTDPLRMKLVGLKSSDAWNVFGIDSTGAVVRVTPSENRTQSSAQPWRFSPPAHAREVIPQIDGALVILADSGASTYLWRVFPPEQRILQRAVLPHVTSVIRTPLGDRLYFTVDSGLIGVQSRSLDLVPSVRFRKKIQSAVATPSGDRLFIVLEDEKTIRIVDRYQSEVVKRIPLGTTVSELRMDALGRTVLARAATGDSVWVIAIGTAEVVGTVTSAWRADLPVVAPDGSVAVAEGNDVVFLDGTTLQPTRREKRGAAEFWFFFLWSGFRPRAAELDQPVTFATNARDSLFLPQMNVLPETLLQRRVPVPGRSDTAGTTAPGAAKSPGFLIQFAAVLDSSSARRLASAIQFGQQVARVAPLSLDGATVYRVWLGPYATREEAEDVARKVGRAYWVFEAPP